MLSSSLVTTATLLTTIGWLPTGLRWRAADQPVPYCISANSTRTNVSAAAQRQAVLDGINVWVSTGNGGSLSCSTFSVVNATFPCSVGINTQDRRPNIFWETNWSQGSGTIGVTWSVGSGQSCGNVQDDTGQSHNLGCKWDSDIEFNDVHYSWRTNGSSTDITSIAAHEYGHFIGLDHCNDNGTCSAGNAIMYAGYIGGAVRTPFNDDVQGGCGLYPGTQGGLGWPCTQNNQCTSNVCVDPGPNGYCSQSCGTCPTGYLCGNAANPNVCIRDDGRNRGVCEVCNPTIQGACAGGGLCVGGIPEQNTGRCVEPCGAGGTCDPLFRCVTYTDQNNQPIGDFCYPRSSDCTDLNNINELGLGQRCGQATPPCGPNLICVSSSGDGICTQECSGPGQCPAGFACEIFQGGTGYCLPGVNEGDNCADIFVSCAVGPCLRNPQNNVMTCYQDCASDPAICNNAQMCNTYPLQGGGSVTICEPPGVPPNPRDGGVAPNRDGGVVNPNRDGGMVDPNRDGGMSISPAKDAGMSTTGPMFCQCDVTYDCDEDPVAPGFGCPCDPECGPCTCDETFACDPGCDRCDPECGSGGTCACTQAQSTGGPAAPSAALGLGLGFLLLLRRRRR